MYKKVSIEVNDEIAEILSILKEKSKAYIVGGYVRDRLLGLEPKDCDFCTSLSLEEILNLFSDKEKFELKIISESLNIVQLRFKDKKFEIARLREDLKYYGSRKDFDFNFIDDIDKDLLRRDFTINAFAYDGEQLIYIDNISIQDIENKELRFIGDTERKILEDPFRILRLLRFFSEKELLKIDKLAIEMIKKHKNLIWTLPNEMIQSEFINIIKGINYLESFKYINILNLFDELFNIADYQEEYEDRLKSLFINSDLNLLKKLNFSKKLLNKLQVK